MIIQPGYITTLYNRERDNSRKVPRPEYNLSDSSRRYFFTPVLPLLHHFSL